MLATGERGIHQIAAENGHSDSGQCGSGMDEGKKRHFFFDLEDERAHQICSFTWPDNFWVMSHSNEIWNRRYETLSRRPVGGT